MTPHYQQQFYLRPSFITFFNFSHKRPTFAFTSKSAYTFGFAQRIAHSGSQGETRSDSDGGAIITLGAFRTFANLPGPGVSTANFAAFGSWPGVLQKNAESLRNSDALMRVVVPKASRPRWAAWSFFVSDEITACTPYSRNFFQFSRRSSLCCSCASCFSTRSFSARSCSRVFSFVILLDPFS